MVSGTGVLLAGEPERSIVRMVTQQIVAIGGLTVGLKLVRRGLPPHTPVAPSWWWVGPIIAALAALALVPVTDLWASHILNVSPPEWWK